MILVRRGAEPPGLEEVRDRELAKLGGIATVRPPLSKEITGYDVVKWDLWRAQHQKCCYCEKKEYASFEDVEHYRPKAAADRSPGSTERHGYWWLAFTWENLLFACPMCNRTGKNDGFPLEAGGKALRVRDAPPGEERPLLLDPAGTLNPVAHIEFVATSTPRPWWARPRDASAHGTWTIEVCKFNRDELLEARKDYVDNYVMPKVNDLRNALRSRSAKALGEAFDRARGLLRPSQMYVGLAYDALRHQVPDADLARKGLAWPAPAAVAVV